ncbi:MAG: DNA translocase FtsK 4TM domain-containing protein, partial [Bacteroidales bacterium]|nr:DNA translocase FtsK 4TM domain-containing protein [Bacteroidales bacterium]
MGKQKKGNGSSSQKKGSASNSSGENLRFIAGLVLLVFALYLLVVFISYVLSGKADQSLVTAEQGDLPIAFGNWGGKIGFKLSHYFIFNGFGLGSFFIPLIIGAFGLALLKVRYFRLWKNVLRFLLATVL